MPIARNARRSFQFGLTTEMTTGTTYKITNESVLGVNLGTPAAVAVTLPNLPFLGKIVVIKDAGGHALADNITVSSGTVAGTISMPATATIDGASSVVLNSNWQSVGFIYTGSEWKVFFNSATTGGGAGAFSNVTLTGLLFESVTDTITAHAGGGQTSAVLLTTELNRITTVATIGDSVKLPPSVAGLTIFVVNHGANSMQVYGSGTDTIDDVATATGVAQMSGSVTLYTCITAGSWYSEGVGTGYSGGFQTVSYTNGVTAHAGGGQASGVPIITSLTRVTIVASANDSVTLPVSAPGLQLTITNAAASNSLNIFPNAGGTGTETINAIAANGAFALTAGKTVTFVCMVAGLWHTLPLVP